MGAVGACGIDETGLEGMDASLDVIGGNDTSPNKDAGSDAPFDVVIPPACTTLDATACVDADLPDGWTFVGLATSDMPCPQGDAYAPNNYLNDLGLEAGACTCGCVANGSYACLGSLTYGWGPSCNNNAKTGSFDASSAACIDSTQNDPNFEVYGPLPTATGVNVGCDAGVSGTGWTGQEVTTCTPSCAADYCNIPNPFLRCIISTTQTACPAPFQPSLASPIGPPGAVQVECSGCGCSVNTPGGCDASFALYTDHKCMTANFVDAGNPLNVCENAGAMLNSFQYTPYPPQLAGCQATGSGGQAVFNPKITVCCLP